MNAAAQQTLRALPDILLAYGHSDEYSFVFHKSTTLFERRSTKIASTVVSTFTAAYVHLWAQYFCAGASSSLADGINSTSSLSQGKSVELDVAHLPTFDSRTVLYPSTRNLRDYLSWRQADCHINNLYNTTFWALVQQGGMSNTEAEEFLKGTLSSDKNEILWSRFNLNYNNELEIYRKGSVVFREYDVDVKNFHVQGAKDTSMPFQDDDDDDGQEKEASKSQKEKIKKARQKAQIVVTHVDIIKDDFWTLRPWLLSGKPGKTGTLISGG